MPIFKGGKIKNRILIIESSFFKDYSGKEKYLEMLKDSIQKNERILLIDDWFETGSTGKAAINLIESLGGKVISIFVLFNELKPEDEKFFKKYNFDFLIRVHPSYKTKRINT